MAKKITKSSLTKLVKLKPLKKMVSKKAIKKVVKKAIITKTKKVVKVAVKKIAPKKNTKKVAVKKNAKKTLLVKSKKLTKPVIKKVGKKTVVKITKKTVAKKTVKAVVKKPIKVVAKKQLKVVVKKAVKVIAKKVIVKHISKKAPITKVAVIVKPTIVVAKPETISAEKFVKIGVKTKKQLVQIAPLPVIEVSNYPKSKVKTLLISQPKPETEKNPYFDLSKKYNLNETFRQFIRIEGLPAKDFRTQRIDILEHHAVILTSRLAVDNYFRMCNEMRVTVPETMKYFCINEATAYYLQKYIQYRKRKIFFGHQTIQDLVDVIKKNKEEKFLLPASDIQKEQICDFLDALSIKYTKAVMYRTVSANLSDIKNLYDFDMLVFFTPAGIKSLKQNFPNFKQNNTRIACFGVATANELKAQGYRLDVYAPNPKNPSMSGAIDEYIKESNKR